jgi:YD repeat-containing protein
VVDPLGFQSEYTYDRVGNRTGVIDVQRRTTQYVYDSLNRPVEEKGPDGVSKRTEYDVRDRMIEVSSSARLVRCEYDAVGQRTAMSDWNGTTRYQYNATGWLQQILRRWTGSSS